MAVDVLSYAHDFPMAPAGGVFLAIVGAAICLGAPLQRWRQPLLVVGLMLGAAALLVLTKYLTKQLPPPTVLAIAALAVAVAMEAVLFPFVVRKFWSQGPSAVLRAALALVGAHFLLMAPAFGPLIVVLGLACMLNAAVALIVKAIPDSYVWGIDGVLKLALGGLMLLGSPAVGQTIAALPF